MSQFILCRGNLNNLKIPPGLKIIRLTPKDTFLWCVAYKIFKQLNIVKQLWFVTLQDYDYDDSDILFTQAQHEIFAGKDVEQTLLGKFIFAVIDNIDEIVMWYGDYWQDLILVSDKQQLMLLLKQGLEEPMCEVYLRYFFPKML